jgi:hypothetical protein
VIQYLIISARPYFLERLGCFDLADGAKVHAGLELYQAGPTLVPLSAQRKHQCTASHGFRHRKGSS